MTAQLILFTLAAVCIVFVCRDLWLIGDEIARLNRNDQEDI